jgi:hypothetical protein
MMAEPGDLPALAPCDASDIAGGGEVWRAGSWLVGGELLVRNHDSTPSSAIAAAPAISGVRLMPFRPGRDDPRARGAGS